MRVEIEIPDKCLTRISVLRMLTKAADMLKTAEVNEEFEDWQDIIVQELEDYRQELDSLYRAVMEARMR